MFEIVDRSIFRRIVHLIAAFRSNRIASHSISMLHSFLHSSTVLTSFCSSLPCTAWFGFCSQHSEYNTGIWKMCNIIIYRYADCRPTHLIHLKPNPSHNPSPNHTFTFWHQPPGHGSTQCMPMTCYILSLPILVLIATQTHRRGWKPYLRHDDSRRRGLLCNSQNHRVGTIYYRMRQNNSGMLWLMVKSCRKSKKVIALKLQKS